MYLQVIGSPLIKRYNNNLIIGIHFGSQKRAERTDNELLCNLAIPFDAIIKDIIEQLSENDNNYTSNENKGQNMNNEKQQNQHNNNYQDDDLLLDSKIKYVENLRIQNATYTGEVLNGKRHGKGIQIWDD